MNSKQITLWYKNIDGDLHYNHLEDGWCQSNTPTAKFPVQEKAWKGFNWLSKHALLVDGIVKEDE